MQRFLDLKLLFSGGFVDALAQLEGSVFCSTPLHLFFWRTMFTFSVGLGCILFATLCPCVWAFNAILIADKK
uniref:Uncharacterized protein n=1 Tax=Manihot esculenta TaxID=3983 RepID=A0A2C9VA23_MANES